jgi:hypothetical protein
MTLKDVYQLCRPNGIHYAAPYDQWQQLADAIVEKAVNDGKEALTALRKMTDADRDSEFGLAMRVGYGVDSNEQQTIDADFSAVHGLDA